MQTIRGSEGFKIAKPLKGKRVRLTDPPNLEGYMEQQYGGYIARVSYIGNSNGYPVPVVNSTHNGIPFSTSMERIAEVLD